MQMVRSEITLEKNMSKSKTLFDYMTPDQKAAMSYVDSKGIRQRYPSWHSICMDKTGVARPGKTARDRANKLRRLFNE